MIESRGRMFVNPDYIDHFILQIFFVLVFPVHFFQPGIALEEFENSLISVTQSMQFGKFVASLEFEKLVSTDTSDRFSAIYEGSDVDAEDLLVHKEGFKREVSLHRSAHVLSVFFLLC